MFCITLNIYYICAVTNIIYNRIMEEKIVYPDIFKTAWRGLKSQFWLLVGLVIGFTIIYSFFIIFTIPEKVEPFGISNIIVGIFGMLLSGLFGMGYLKNCMQTLDGEEPQFSAYGQVSRKLPAFIATYIIYSLIVLIGLVLFIIPGIYLGIRFQFYLAFIVEDNCGIIESFKRSWNITKGCSMKLFVLGLIMILISFAGSIALFVGIFIAVPLIVLMYGCTYRKLTEPVAQ